MLTINDDPLKYTVGTPYSMLKYTVLNDDR